MVINYREREKIVQSHLYSYQSDKRDVEEYVERALGRSSRSFEAQIKSNTHSDPTAKSGLMLAEMPTEIALKSIWCDVIEDAWAECCVEGDGSAIILEKNFALKGEGHEKERNAEHRLALCAEFGISESTYYARLKNATLIVMYHAARKGLI